MSQRIELPVIDDDDDDELDVRESSQDGNNADMDEDNEDGEGSLLNQCPSGEHVSDAIKIRKCACVISSTEREKYDSCLVNGRQLEVEGKVSEAAMSYMDALELMDSDYSVHVKVLELAEQMNFQPPLIETA